MARYEVRGPDGGRYEVTMPDGMTPEEIRGKLDEYFAKMGIETRRMPNGQPQQGVKPAATPREFTASETAVDVIKGTGSGLVKGGAGLVGLPGTVETLGRAGINAAGSAMGRTTPLVSSQNTLPNYENVKGAIERNITGELYEPQTTMGQYAQTIGEFAPGMLIPGGAAVSMGRRAAQGVLLPAVASETAGQMTKGGAYEPYARVAGAVAGAVAPGVAGRMISPGAVTDPQRAQMAATLDREGVRLTAGDRTGSQTLRYAESTAQQTPGAGTRATQVKTAQAEDFTQATLRRAGIDSRRATPDVIDDAFNRIGQEFERAANRIAVPVFPRAPQGMPPLVQNVVRHANEYERIMEPSMRSALPRAIAQDLQALAGQRGHMAGDTYLAWRSQLGAAARGTQDPRTRNTLYQIQEALDDAAQTWLTRGGARDVAQGLQQARQQYRNMLVIERAAASAGENAALGLLSPSALRNATQQMGRRDYARGRGDFADLARAGEAMLRPLPNSGTAPRVMMNALGAGVGAAVAGAPGAVAGALAPAAGQAAMGRAVMSPVMQRYLSNQAAAPFLAQPNAPQRMLLPGASVEYGDAQPVNNLLSLYQGEPY